MWGLAHMDSAWAREYVVPMVPMNVELLVPASYDIVWTIMMVALLALVVWAIVAITRGSRRRRREMAALRADMDALKGEAQLRE